MQAVVMGCRWANWVDWAKKLALLYLRCVPLNLTVKSVTLERSIFSSKTGSPEDVIVRAWCLAAMATQGHQSQQQSFMVIAHFHKELREWANPQLSPGLYMLIFIQLDYPQICIILHVNIQTVQWYKDRLFNSLFFHECYKCFLQHNIWSLLSDQ